MSEETTENTPRRRRGRPPGSKNRPKANGSKVAVAAPTASTASTAPVRRRRTVAKVVKNGDFDPASLTFDQVIATVKYAQDKIEDIAPILQQSE